MERTPSPRNIELAGIADVLNEGRMASNLQLRIAHLEPQTLTIGKDTRVAALEFCVHGIVVHLRLGNCIGYSLRESIPIDPFVAESPSSVAWYGQPSERQGH